METRSLAAAFIWHDTTGEMAGGERAGAALPNVRAKLPEEAGAVSLVRDDAPSAADQAYSACRSGSA